MIVAAMCVTPRENEDAAREWHQCSLGILVSIDWCSVLHKDFLKVRCCYFPK